ncbi:DUF3800 domain-containing protein [Streptomyces sp. I4(2020)]|uniref:DUF3800 domain-containing protein n=1 Tax=Streptomyces sp. I4(2020) TaxID=2760981 RepID=UPI0018EE527E|nr:DUF3800 domain-containing protein [Streptomyces sp. I4(2020)]MBJ6613940.1 DUF3800 domain-containing protein [Streptomyces sp. I3(2020)]MBJ6630218.1 DUF3800 domain-containing protein [Streptomyces sp. I4(2020)]
MATRIFYLDDSGTVDTGFIVYGWLEIDIVYWSRALRCWLDFRKKLYRDTGIPADFEIHSTKFINGRDRPSTDAGWNRSKENRRVVAQQALAQLAYMPSARAGAVYRCTDKKGAAYGDERAAVYTATLHYLDRQLAGAGDHGIIVMDGDGSDLSYQREHRKLKLATRHIVEDPWFAASDTNQPVQVADLLAYTAYQATLKHAGKKFMWDWWGRHLPAADAPLHL